MANQPFQTTTKREFPSSCWQLSTLFISVIGLILLPTYSYEWEGTVEEDTECLMVSESILCNAEDMYSNT